MPIANPEIVTQVPFDRAEALVDGLPVGAYTDLYQPPFQRGDLIEAVHELQNTQGVTTPENIFALRQTLAAVSAGEITDPIVIAGRCAEPVDAETSISSLVRESLQNLSIAKRGLGRVIVILRNRGQNGKPRSSELQTLADGRQVYSHYGDAANGARLSARTPDPSRLVAAAVQARDVEAGLTEFAGGHVPAAHEALFLAYEQSFIRDDSGGRRVSLSGDLLWVGDRTRDPEGPHVAMLSQIENTVGVKLGPTAAAADVAALHDKLNPGSEAGKLVFMIRTGLDNADKTAELLDAIKTYAPESILLYDIHGSTVNVNGRKIRAVKRIVAEIEQLHGLCRERDLKLHGVHLETEPSENRRECVDNLRQIPRDTPVVDPLLNRHQTLKIYRRLGKLMLRDRHTARTY